MRTGLVVLVPAALFVGLVVGAMKLSGLLHRDATPCTLGQCPLALHEGDSGKTFTYNVTTRFTLFFDQRRNPHENLRCTPEGILRAMSDSPYVEPPLYAAVLEGVAPGNCILTDDHFSATIIIQ